MNIFDVLIVLFLISSLVRGIELGVLRQIFSTSGLLGGLLLGAFIQGRIIHVVHTPASKALLALVVILMSIVTLVSVGEHIGARLKSGIERAKLKGLNTLDKTLGSLVAGASLLLIVWLGATIFVNTPIASLQRQIKGSVIIAQLNKTLPSAPDVVARLGHLIDPNSFPNVFTGLEPEIDTQKPLPSIGELDPAVQKARASVVKVEGKGCGGISQGSGFVADNGLVITNAHVIAGVKGPYVVDTAGKHRAEVAWFDPDLDMAVLRTTGLSGQPLDLYDGLVAPNTPAAVLGYPGGADFTANPAVVLESFRAVGRNIYNQHNTTREIYSINGAVQPGNSGGPLIDRDGDVIGLIFAESTTYDNVGYALTAGKVIEGLNLAKDRAQTVGTGSCTQ